MVMGWISFLEVVSLVVCLILAAAVYVLAAITLRVRTCRD
jgi:hypothetical protein